MMMFVLISPFFTVRSIQNTIVGGGLNTYICRANNFLGAFSVVGLVLVRMTYVVTVLWAATFNGSKDRRKTFSNTNFGIREKSAQKL